MAYKTSSSTLNQLITVQKCESIPDGQKGYTKSWITVAKNVPAGIYQYSSNEQAQDGRIVLLTQIKFTIRTPHFPLDETMRVIHNGRTYEIISPPILDHRAQFVEIFVRGVK